MGDSVELVCKLKEVGVWSNHSDLTPPPQTRDRTRRVRTLLSVIIHTYFLLAWINSFGMCTVPIARNRKANLAHSD